MKKLLLSLAAATLGLSGFATSVTFDFTTNNYGLERKSNDDSQGGYIANATKLTSGDVTITLNSGITTSQGNTGWRLWSDGLREYNKQNPSFIVSTTNGEEVTQVTFTVNSGATFKVEGYENDENITSWTGSASSVTFVGTATGNAAVKTITVTYGEVATPLPDPVVPDAPTGTITVAQALELIEQGYEGEATVKGYIIDIEEVSTQYGNATYTIADEATAASGLVVYRGKYLEGEAFSEENQIKVGAQVVVNGSLVDYNGTKEFKAGSTILSYVAPEGDDDTNDDPLEGSETATFNFADPSSLGVTIPAGEEELNMVGVTLKSGVISLTGDGEGQNVPRLFYSSTSSNPAWTYRFYNGNTVTISCEEGYVLTGIEFTQTNLGTNTITWSAGTYKGGTWLAGDAEVTSLVISKTATGNNPTITNMTVYYSKATGVEEIATEVNNAPAVYYNLQGVRVANPAKGQIYIVNGKKVIF